MTDKNPKADSTPLNAENQKDSKLDKFGRSYATGRRKESVSRVWVKQGSGVITVNGKESG